MKQLDAPPDVRDVLARNEEGTGTSEGALNGTDQVIARVVGWRSRARIFMRRRNGEMAAATLARHRSYAVNQEK